MPIPGTPPLPRLLLRDGVYERLRDAVVDGSLAPGEQLRDQDLATWLGVSRTPVREALLRLGRAGLVIAEPGRSTVVAPLDVAAVRDAAGVVAAMHRLAVREAVARLAEPDLAAMRTANAAFAEALARGDTDAAVRADDAFHAVPVDVCGNSAVRDVLDQFGPVLRRAERLRFGSLEGRDSVARHDLLVTLCAAGDAENAARVAEETWLTLTIDPEEGPSR